MPSAARELRAALGGEDPAHDRGGEEVAVAQARRAEGGRLELGQPVPGRRDDEELVGRLEAAGEHQPRVHERHRDDAGAQQRQRRDPGQQPPERDRRPGDQHDRGELARARVRAPSHTSASQREREHGEETGARRAPPTRAQARTRAARAAARPR